MSTKKSVAILFGGKSVEHQISINSAKNVAEHLDSTQYDLILIGISPQGEWFLKKEVDGYFDSEDRLQLILSATHGGFHHTASGKSIYPDIIFPVLHGTDGEDGSIQGLLRVINIPFVGTGVVGSAVCMSKLYSKRILSAAGIPVSNYIAYEMHEKEDISFENIQKQLGLPFMAKASNLGSSVGVHKVRSEGDFTHAVKDIFNFDDVIIFEQYIAGRELECSVMGNEQPEASLPAEIVISKNYDFYTYEAKYLDPNAVELKIPAEIDEETSKRMRELSIQSYKALKCEDFARVDLFLSDNGNIVINEINSIPGFTNSSMFPMMWQERGISFTDLITKLINMAEDRYRNRQHISNLLGD